METPWLIQRAKFRDSDRKGINGIISLDYMGSAEFEFGSVFQSLNRIRSEFSKYEYFSWTWAFATDRPITIFCKTQDKEEVKTVLVELVHGRLRLKEWCDLKDYLDPGSRSHNSSDLWWDIVNNFMFWKQDREFETKFKEAIKPK